MSQKEKEILKEDRRVRKSKEMIKKAMIELMTKKDFDEITIQNIADQADVSRGTVYLHYTDKYDLVEKMIAEHMAALCKLSLSTAESDHPRRTILWMEHFERHFKFFSIMLASKCAYCLHMQFMDLHVFLIKRDLISTGLKYKGIVDEDVITNWTSSASTGLIEWWIRENKPVSSQLLAEQLGMLFDINLKI